MHKHFQRAVEEFKIGELESKIFMDFIQSYEEQFCIQEGDSGLNTLEQVKKNAIFLKLKDDLLKMLIDVMEKEEDMTALIRPYTDTESQIFLSMCDKVACLLTNKT